MCPFGKFVGILRHWLVNANASHSPNVVYNKSYCCRCQQQETALLRLHAPSQPFYETVMTKTALLVVDVQKGFINEHAAHIPDLVQGLIPHYQTIFATRFYNPEARLTDDY
jgi:hypothetical protein